MTSVQVFKMDIMSVDQTNDRSPNSGVENRRRRYPRYKSGIGVGESDLIEQGLEFFLYASRLDAVIDGELRQKTASRVTSLPYTAFQFNPIYPFIVQLIIGIISCKPGYSTRSEMNSTM